jgi:hypothetical protein
MHRTAVLLAVLKAGRRSVGVAGAIVMVTDAIMSLLVNAGMSLHDRIFDTVSQHTTWEAVTNPRREGKHAPSSSAMHACTLGRLQGQLLSLQLAQISSGRLHQYW